jgi:hypothetical protein
MRRGYVFPMRWMVIYEYGVPGGASNINSTNYPDHGHHGDPPLSGKNPHKFIKWTLFIIVIIIIIFSGSAAQRDL